MGSIKVPILDAQVSQNTDTQRDSSKQSLAAAVFSFLKFVYKKFTNKNVGYPAFSWVNSL